MTVSAPHTRTAADLWEHIFGDQTGLMAVWSGRRVPGQQELADPSTRYYQWPGQAGDASNQLDHESDNGREAYVCAHLLTKRRRIKDNAALMLAAYVDGDGAQPRADLPAPTAVVESSPGRQQFYWRFTTAIDPKRAEQISKRLAYAMGADKSGWDLTQVLRAPGARNWKYTPAPTVEIVSIEDRAYDPDELEQMLPELPVETTARTEVKLERSVAATPIGDRDRRVQARMYASKRGSEIQMLAHGGSLHRKPDGSPDHSADDQSYANPLAFWFDKDSARMAAEMRRSNRVRNKWSEVHSANGETYLEMTIGKAIASCSQSFRDLRGHDAGDDPPSIGRIQLTAPEQPVTTDQDEGTIPGDPATLDEAMIEIRRLRRGLLDRDDRIEMMTGIIADQQTVIAATRAERDQLVDLRAIDRRVSLAEQRLDRCQTYSAGQKAAIKAVARIAPALANSLQKDDPIITRNMVAEVTGAKVDTTGGHLKVFDLAGSPVPRELRPYGPKDLTHYKLVTRDPAEIIERMAALGEHLEKRPTARKTRRCKTCPEGTGTIVNIVCEGCGCLLDERHVAAPKAERDDNVGKNPTLVPPPAPVNVPVTYGGEKSDVADAPETVERSAKVTPLRPRTVRHHADVEIDEAAERRDMDLTGTCQECREYTVKRRRSGVWTCAKCSAVLLVEPWAEQPPERAQEPPRPRCARVGCEEPAANGFICTGHLRGDPLPAMMGAET